MLLSLHVSRTMNGKADKKRHPSLSRNATIYRQTRLQHAHKRDYCWQRVLPTWLYHILARLMRLSLSKHFCISKQVSAAPVTRAYDRLQRNKNHGESQNYVTFMADWAILLAFLAVILLLAPLQSHLNSTNQTQVAQRSCIHLSHTCWCAWALLT